MDTLVDQSTSARRAITRLAVFFAAVALLLSAVALYGLVSAGVTERSREIGVRMALGAPGGRIMREILVRGVTTAGIGAAAGIALAIPGHRHRPRAAHGRAAVGDRGDRRRCRRC